MQQPRVEVVQQGGLWVVEADAGEQPEQEQQPEHQQREWRVGPFPSHEAAAEAAQLLRRKLGCAGAGSWAPGAEDEAAADASGYGSADEQEDLQHCSLAELVQLLQEYVVDPGDKAGTGQARSGADEGGSGGGSTAGVHGSAAAEALGPGGSGVASAVVPAGLDTSGDELLALRLQQEEEAAAVAARGRRSSRRHDPPQPAAAGASPRAAAGQRRVKVEAAEGEPAQEQAPAKRALPSAAAAPAARGARGPGTDAPPGIDVKETADGSLRYHARMRVPKSASHPTGRVPLCTCATLARHACCVTWDWCGRACGVWRRSWARRAPSHSATRPIGAHAVARALAQPPRHLHSTG